MASKLGHVFLQNVVQCRNQSLKMCLSHRFIHCTGVSSLFHEESLGLESYKNSRAQMELKLGGMKEGFRVKMEDYMERSNKNTIFTDDLKTMVHLAQTKEDIATCSKLILRFHKQGADMRLSNFTFGPVVMRMFHTLNKPKQAFELFSNPELKGFFEQTSSYTTLLDLLFENSMYKEVLDCLEIIKRNLREGHFLPSDCVMLGLAACLKMNSEESLSKAARIIHDCHTNGSKLSMRSTIYASILAIKQGRADMSLEILSSNEPQQRRFVPIAYRNAKVLSYAGLGRIEEVLHSLSEVYEEQNEFQRQEQIFPDVLSDVKNTISKTGSKDNMEKFETMEKSLENSNMICPIHFEEYIYKPVVIRRQLQDGFKHRKRSGVFGFTSDHNTRNQTEFKNYRTNTRHKNKHGLLHEQEDKMSL